MIWCFPVYLHCKECHITLKWSQTKNFVGIWKLYHFVTHVTTTCGRGSISWNHLWLIVEWWVTTASFRLVAGVKKQCWYGQSLIILWLAAQGQKRREASDTQTHTYKHYNKHGHNYQLCWKHHIWHEELHFSLPTAVRVPLTRYPSRWGEEYCLDYKLVISQCIIMADSVLFSTLYLIPV